MDQQSSSWEHLPDFVGNYRGPPYNDEISESFFNSDQSLPMGFLRTLPGAVQPDSHNADTIPLFCTINGELTPSMSITATSTMKCDYTNRIAAEFSDNIRPLVLGNPAAPRTDLPPNMRLYNERNPIPATASGGQGGIDLAMVQRNQPPDSVLKCEWKGCKSKRSFGRRAELERHVKSIHISPDAYQCPVIGCEKSFGRKDRMESHKRQHEDTGKQ